MRGVIEEAIEALSLMQNYPQKLSYSGDPSLLKRKKISVIGSRKPNPYTKAATHQLSQALSRAGICIVSGGAMGVDAIAHGGAKASNTVAVLPNGLDHKYPAINKKLLASIEKEGLLLSQFDDDFKATPWSFVVRNELVVALGEILVVTQADLDSGSMRSVEFALDMGKEIYVLPHRLGESKGTNSLLQKGLAKAIYDIDEFAARFAGIQNILRPDDEFIEFCKGAPTYDEAMLKYQDKVYEAELEGQISVRNGKVYVI
ncbi:DNA-processing protein DprA [Sulfurimonas sp. HSL-1716]|uniref:DNA-processing protein DprA n=1 Tax=Hydrocurvibacter sulfurireducens TaxID=3131937 RepID=UPI0031F800FB